MLSRMTRFGVLDDVCGGCPSPNSVRDLTERPASQADKVLLHRGQRGHPQRTEWVSVKAHDADVFGHTATAFVQGTHHTDREFVVAAENGGDIVVEVEADRVGAQWVPVGLADGWNPRRRHVPVPCASRPPARSVVPMAAPRCGGPCGDPG